MLNSKIKPSKTSSQTPYLEVGEQTVLVERGKVTALAAMYLVHVCVGDVFLVLLLIVGLVLTARTLESLQVTLRRLQTYARRIYVNVSNTNIFK